MDSIDVKLVALAKSGDDEAFSKIYEQIYKDMYKYALYMLNNRNDAEDIVSETVMDIYTGIKKLRKEELFSNWAFKILANKCRMKRKQYINKEYNLDETREKESKDVIENVEMRKDIENAFEILESDEIEVVSMAIFGEYKSNEIAKILGMKSGTVRSKLSRAFKKLQPKLEV